MVAELNKLMTSPEVGAPPRAYCEMSQPEGEDGGFVPPDNAASSDSEVLSLEKLLNEYDLIEA